MTEKIIHLFVGLPGVGKSTMIAKTKLAEEVVLSSDAYIEKYAAEEGKTYDQVFTEAIKDATAHFNSELDRHLRDGTPYLIIDRTNLTAAARSRFVQLAKKYGYKIYAYDLNHLALTDPGEWKRRLDSRPGKKIPKYVLENMKDTYEPVTEDEGFDYVYSSPSDSRIAA